MNSFIKAIETNIEMGQTYNGAMTYANTSNHLLDLFALIGSKAKSDLYPLFEKLFAYDKSLALKMLFWSRDCRGGAGRRDNFRSIMLNLSHNRPEITKEILKFIPEYGRFDDLLLEWKDPLVKTAAYDLYAKALETSSVSALAAKWAPRKGKIANELRNHMGLSPKAYRKMLVGLSNVVESKMCAKDWSEIEYSHIPSVAFSRYTNAFKKHDTLRYAEFMRAVDKGERKINTSVLYPHDAIKTLEFNPDEGRIIWENLPNYITKDSKILPVVDVSGSMRIAVSGKTTALDVAVSLGLYISDKNSGDFKDIFMTFSRTPNLVKLNGDIVSKYNQLTRSDWGYNTDIEACFSKLLDFAKTNGVSKKDMPDMILIMSDMEFDAASRSQTTNFENIKRMYRESDFDMPSLVFWNIAGRSGNYPVNSKHKNVALVSGYSPTILLSILEGEIKNPVSIIYKVLSNKRYDFVDDLVKTLES